MKHKEVISKPIHVKHFQYSGKGKGIAKGGALAKGKGGKGAPGKGSGGKGTRGVACAVCGKANVLTSACTCPACVRCKFRFCPGAPGAWRAIEYNDLFFAFVTVGNDPVLSRSLLRPQAASIECEINEAEVNSAGQLSCIDPKVWAARLVTGHCDGRGRITTVDGLKMIKKAVKGMDSMKALTNVDTHTIEHDRHRRGQVAKRQPTNVERDPKERIYTPGSRFVIDAFTFPGREQVSQGSSHPTRIGIKGRVTSSESIQARPKLGGVRVGKPVPAGRPGRMHVELRRARQSDGTSQRGRQPRQARVGQAGHRIRRTNVLDDAR